MKKLVLLTFFSTLALFSFAQQETLFGGINHIGGFGGPFIEVSQINGQTVADVGGGGALTLDNFFFGGYGLGTDSPNINVGTTAFDLDFGHGGLWFGYAHKQHKLIHIYSSFKFGWGEASIKETDKDAKKLYSDNVLVLSPELGIELNLTSWFKLGLTGGYRYVDGISDGIPETFALTNDSFSSGFGSITFRFGGFGDWDNDNDKGKDFDTNFDF